MYRVSLELINIARKVLRRFLQNAKVPLTSPDRRQPILIAEVVFIFNLGPDDAVRSHIHDGLHIFLSFLKSSDRAVGMILHHTFYLQLTRKLSRKRCLSV